VDDVTGLKFFEAREPADGDTRLDPIIESHEMIGAPRSQGEADAADAVGVDLGAGQEVIDGADVIPENHAGPREAGGEDSARHELFHRAAGAVELADILAGFC